MRLDQAQRNLDRELNVLRDQLARVVAATAVLQAAVADTGDAAVGLLPAERPATQSMRRPLPEALCRPT